MIGSGQVYWARAVEYPLGELPLPPTAFGTFEALLTPGAQAMPGNSADSGRQIREDKPRVGVTFAPPSQ